MDVFLPHICYLSYLSMLNNCKPEIKNVFLCITFAYGLRALECETYPQFIILTMSYQTLASFIKYNNLIALTFACSLSKMVYDGETNYNLTNWQLIPLFIYTYGCFYIDKDSCFSPFHFIKKRMLIGKMKSSGELRDIDTVRNWAIQQNPTIQTTSHWWVSDLGKEARDAFHRVEKSGTIRAMFNEKFNLKDYAFEVMDVMNELYISGPNREGTSDQIFFTEHIDGPWFLIPFASVYRCIVGMDENTEISTVFPNASITAQKGDVLAFDYNREPHYIVSDGSRPNKDFRIVMKLHYCVYPKQLVLFGKLCKWLTIGYNILFRWLFISTLAPKSPFVKMVGYLMNVVTDIFNNTHVFIGYNNALYIAACAYACYKLECYNLFLLLTQFVHYFRYITTYYCRTDVDYIVFKRDVFLFKCVALSQIAYLTIANYNRAELYWIVLIIVGYTISGCATYALGVDGTYFGIELGFVKADYNFVKSFPYNVIPHPMIIGQIIGLIGVHQFVKYEYPLLIPAHIALYTVHMIQEIYDIHAGVPYYKTK
jgi:hypothetical protein